jgi:hypothetical protein
MPAKTMHIIPRDHGWAVKKEDVFVRGAKNGYQSAMKIYWVLICYAWRVLALARANYRSVEKSLLRAEPVHLSDRRSAA